MLQMFHFKRILIASRGSKGCSISFSYTLRLLLMVAIDIVVVKKLQRHLLPVITVIPIKDKREYLSHLEKKRKWEKRTRKKLFHNST